MNLAFIHHRNLIIVYAILFSSVFLSFGCEKGPETQDTKLVALTFDDGPDSVCTAKILDILKKEDVKATFFVLGKKVRMYPEIVKRECREGHLIGNHTFDHCYLPKVQFNKILKNIDLAQSIIDSVCGYSSMLFRPTWGMIEQAQQDSLKCYGYKIVFWDVDIKQNKNNKNVYNTYDVPSIISAITDNIKPNNIILLHDSNYGNKEDRMVIVQALPTIIDKLKAMGYTFVTADKLIPGNKLTL
ncbi:MAG: polysaccharide deacetylase family protein [Bacteroidetes bacterium]|nr:polysaccharide deacetylase family protein [Bacteroidota bacterium]